MKEQINTPTRTTTQTNSAVCELEQIKEIAKVLCEKYDTEHCKVCDHNGRCMVRLEAEWIYEAGYSKQSEGEWIIKGECWKILQCSACDYTTDTIFDKTPFCPNCGAHMKGGAE